MGAGSVRLQGKSVSSLEKVIALKHKELMDAISVTQESPESRLSYL